MRPENPDRHAELEKLFAELAEVYARAREGASLPATSRVSLRVREEGARATQIIQRIREIQGL
jgi:hypothetical protein